MKQAFADRKAPSLDEAGKDREQRVLVYSVQFDVRKVVDDVDPAVKVVGRLQQVHQTADPPAMATDEDEVRHFDAALDQLLPDLDDIGVVLATLDGRHIRNILAAANAPERVWPGLV